MKNCALKNLCDLIETQDVVRNSLRKNMRLQHKIYLTSDFQLSIKDTC